MAVKATATRFGGVVGVGTDGTVRIEVEYWLSTDASKRGKYAVVIPPASSGSNNNVINYIKSHLATYLTTLYTPLTFSSGDILLFGFN